MPDPADLGLRAARDAIAAGELSSAELVEACLHRAHELDVLGAFVALDEDGARDAAAAYDAALGAGDATAPLHGVPVAIKDLADVAGLPTRAGSAATDDRPASADAPIVERLRGAGMVVMGKTATHEFAYGVATRSTRNPWDPSRLAGGSSGGSAVAVAVGACRLALGTDTAGSCRIPAALCGVAGMMARPGRLPGEGIVPLSRSLDAVGFLARTAADLALAWSVLSGDVVDAARAPRVGTVARKVLGEIDPEAAAAAETAAALLSGNGRRPSVIDVPPFAEWARPRGVVIGAEALADHRRRGWWPQRAARYGAGVAEHMRGAEDIDDASLAAARARLGELAHALRSAFQKVDVVVLPTTPSSAPARDGDEPVERQDRRHAAELTRLCGPVNAAGLAAVSVFGGLDAHGLPLGVQIVARDEATALGAALAHEALAGAPPRPPLAGAPPRPPLAVRGGVQGQASPS